MGHPSGQPKQIQLLITDVVMPGMKWAPTGGSEAEDLPNAPVLDISGYTNSAIVHDGVLDDALWFLPKPFTLAALVSKVREVLDAYAEAKRAERSQ